MKIEQHNLNTSNDIIHSAWTIKLEKDRAKEGYCFFPDNLAEIIVALKGSFSRRIVGHRKEFHLIQGEAVMAKTRSRGMIIKSDSDISVLMIKLNPQYLSYFVQNPHYKFRDEVQKFSVSSTFRQDWANALFYKEKERLINIIQKYVEDLISGRPIMLDSLIDKTISLIRAQKGEIKIKDLNEILGICKSTLEQKFNREIGISPKEFCKIEKLTNFLKNYDEFHGEMSLTQLTFKSGYYDQSHLIKDFRYYVEDSPKRFLNHANKVMLYA